MFWAKLPAPKKWTVGPWGLTVRVPIRLEPLSENGRSSILFKLILVDSVSRPYAGFIPLVYGAVGNDCGVQGGVSDWC